MSPKDALTRDLKVGSRCGSQPKACNEEDMPLFFNLVPLIYKYFKDLAVGNKDLVYLIVSTIDASQVCHEALLTPQLHSLSCQLFLKEFSIFGDAVFPAVGRSQSSAHQTESSLDWETFEQFSMWQLLEAEFSHAQSAVESFLLPVLKILDPSGKCHDGPDNAVHSEALSGVLFLVKSLEPSVILVSTFLSMSLHYGRLPICALSNWTISHPEKLRKSMVEVSHRKCLRPLQVFSECISNTNRDKAILIMKQLSVWQKRKSTNPIWHDLQGSVQSVMKAFGLSTQFPNLLKLMEVKEENVDMELEFNTVENQQHRKRLRKMQDYGGKKQ